LRRSAASAKPRDRVEYYADWELDGGVPTETVQYLAGVFQMVPGGTSEYYHGNQIGTTRFMTGYDDPRPVVTREAVHTAFGELKWTEAGSTATRYGYAGAHGYEEGLGSSGAACCRRARTRSMTPSSTMA
jgi:hypothetical protein